MIRASQLTYGYDDTVILQNLSFTIKPNEFVSFIGPSGCGKTTLLNLVSGILKTDKSSLSVDTEHISFVFQHDTLLPWRNTLNNVLLPFEIKGIKITDRLRRRALDILKKVGLENFEHFYPSELSGGMKKRVEIARALVTEPDLLILDEPFSSLDIITREKLNLLIKELKHTTAGTIILVTHSVEEACFLSDWVYVLAGKPAEIVSRNRIKRDKAGKPEGYMLTGDELAADGRIREEAKLLWNIQPGAEKMEKNKTGAREKKGSLLLKMLIPLELLLLFALLAGIKYLLKIEDYLLPYPWAIAERFYTTFINGSIFIHLGTTAAESMTGFLLAFFITLLLGYLIAKSKVAANLTMPYLIAFNTIPSVALAPFLVLWFGFGFTPKIIISIIVIFFPMLINTVSAIGLAEKQMQTLIKFYNPSGLIRFTRFEMPASLPVIFSGVKVSITLSVIGAVVGEFISGAEGLGALVVTAKANFDTELMFVALIWLIILGLSYYGLATFAYWIINKKIHH